MLPAAFAKDKQAAATPKAETTTAPAQETARGAAYYHLALAHSYEDMAANTGRQDYATRAVEEYKLALNADPSSAFLNNGLAELYFRTGRVRDAILTAQETIKREPKNIAAHKLLGRVYLHSLGDMQNGASQQVLDLAIGEYKQISALDPTDIQSHLVLGQLYTVNHESQQAQQEFEAAQKIDPNSEDVALNLARLYGESGDLKRAIDTLKAVPEDDRSAKLSFALGAGYDQIKDTKDAVTAYQQAVDMDPDNLDAKRALAQALLNNNQLADAEHAYQEIAAADPQDAQALVRIAECQRRQGHYEQALATLKKAQALSTDSEEILFNEALTYDALGRYSGRDPGAARSGVPIGEARQPLQRQREDQPLYLSRPAGKCRKGTEPHRSSGRRIQADDSAGRRVRGARLSGRCRRLSGRKGIRQGDRRCARGCESPAGQ